MMKKWLAACSGGPDSMALVSMCMEKGIAFSTAIVNYHVRPEADEEVEYVKAYCASHGIVCHVKDDPFVWSGNFEAAARKWRYDFFVSLVKQYGYAGVLVAHHKDDVIETWLMQRERGIVPMWYGLKEESTYQGMIIRRPLLGYEKKDLVQYCLDHHLKYYIDQTNLSGENTRSRLRQHVYTSDEKNRMLEEIDRANERLRAVRKEAAECFDEKGIDKNIYGKKEKDVRLTALRELLDPSNDRHLTKKYLEEIDHMMGKKDFLIMDHDKWIVTDGRHVWRREKGEGYAYRYEDVRYEEKKYYAIRRTGKSTDAVTVRKEDFPLCIRAVEDGDAIAMRYGMKKVHRFFIDRHIPLYMRKTWPVVVNHRNEIILVPGLGCDVNHYSSCPSFFVHVKSD